MTGSKLCLLTESGDRSFFGSLRLTGIDGSSSIPFGAGEALKGGGFGDSGFDGGERILLGSLSFTRISTLSKFGIGRARKVGDFGMVGSTVGLLMESGDRSFFGSLRRTGMDGSSSIFFGAGRTLKWKCSWDSDFKGGDRMLLPGSLSLGWALIGENLASSSDRRLSSSLSRESSCPF